MTRFDRDGQRLFCMHVKQGQPELRQGHKASCFLIVEHLDNEDFIRLKSLAMMMSGCDRFRLYGKQEPLWYRLMDYTEWELYKDGPDEPSKMIVGYDDPDGFAEELARNICIREFTLRDTFLMYDDPAAYRDMIGRLEKAMCRED